jgi:hypothetical protein
MLNTAGIDAANDRIINSSDWAVFFQQMLQTYRVENPDRVFRLFQDAFPKVYRDPTLLGVDDPEHLPNGISSYTEPIFNRLFPRFRVLMSDPYTAEGADGNIVKKVSLAMMYALEYSDLVEQGEKKVDSWEKWLDTRMKDDMKPLGIVIRERRNGLKDPKVTLKENQYFMEWVVSRSVTWQRIIVENNFREDERKAYEDAAHLVVNKLFPEEIFAQMIGRTYARRGDIKLESIYRSLTAFALANGLSPQGLIKYFSVVGDGFVNYANSMVKDITISQMAQVAESDRMRHLLRILEKNNQTNREKNDLQSQIKIEFTEEVMALAVNSALYWAQEFLRDGGFLSDGSDKSIQRALEPKNLDTFQDNFAEFSDKVVALKSMPEVQRLLQVQQQIGKMQPLETQKQIRLPAEKERKTPKGEDKILVPTEKKGTEGPIKGVQLQQYDKTLYEGVIKLRADKASGRRTYCR